LDPLHSSTSHQAPPSYLALSSPQELSELQEPTCTPRQELISTQLSDVPHLQESKSPAVSSVAQGGFHHDQVQGHEYPKDWSRTSKNATQPAHPQKGMEESSSKQSDPRSPSYDDAKEVIHPTDKTPLGYRLLPSGKAIIDLHGLPVEVAKIAVQVALEDLLLHPISSSQTPVMPQCRRTKETGGLIIVTGRGKHSLGGVPLIKPAVYMYLREHLGINVVELPIRGRLFIPASELRRFSGVPEPI